MLWYLGLYSKLLLIFNDLKSVKSLLKERRLSVWDVASDMKNYKGATNSKQAMPLKNVKCCFIKIS